MNIETVTIFISLIAIILAAISWVDQRLWNRKQEYELNKGVLNISIYQLHEHIAIEVYNGGNTSITIDNISWDNPLLMESIVPEGFREKYKNYHLFDVLAGETIFQRECACYYELPTTKKLNPSLKTIQSGATKSEKNSKEVDAISENIIKAARIISRK